MSGANLVDDLRQNRGFTSISRLVFRIKPVPAPQQTGQARLFGIYNQEPVCFGDLIHSGDLCHILSIVRAAVQHHDQRRSVSLLQRSGYPGLKLREPPIARAVPVIHPSSAMAVSSLRWVGPSLHLYAVTQSRSARHQTGSFALEHLSRNGSSPIFYFPILLDSRAH